MHVIHILYLLPMQIHAKRSKRVPREKVPGGKRVPTSLLPTIPFQFQKFKQFSLVQFQFKNYNVQSSSLNSIPEPELFRV